MAIPFIPLLLKAVPFVASHVIGGKADKFINKALEVAKVITGGKTEEEAVAKLQADPNLFKKFETEIVQDAIELEKERLKDVQDARHRDVELAKLGKENKRADWLIIANYVTCFVLIGLAIIFHVQVGDMILGSILTAFGMFVKACLQANEFEFGSSRGSKEKEQIMKEWE